MVKFHYHVDNLYAMSLQLTRRCTVSSISAPLYERIQCAIVSLPSPHLIPPQSGEQSFFSQADAKERYQNWAFTQKFAIIIEKNNIKHRVYVLECTRHKKESQNTRDQQEGDWIRPATTINAVNCPFRLRIIWQKEKELWLLATAHLTHNYPMQPDPFTFFQYQGRDLDCLQAENLALGMRTSHTKYSQARRTLRKRGLVMKQKDYYNLVCSFEKRTREPELDKALQAYKRQRFHIRFYEKYMVEQDERRRRIVEHAFFCNSKYV